MSVTDLFAVSPITSLTRPITKMLIQSLIINYYWWLCSESNISGYFVSESHTRSTEGP